jgi:hypothetical protein
MRWVELRFEIHHPAWHWTRILIHAYGTDALAIAALPTLFRAYLADLATFGVDGIEAKLRATLIARDGREWHEPPRE